MRPSFTVNEALTAARIHLSSATMRAAKRAVIEQEAHTRPTGRMPAAELSVWRSISAIGGGK